MAVGTADAESFNVQPSGPALDLGCGRNKVPGAIGLDKVSLPEVDIIHDLEIVPYPFRDDTFGQVHLYHVLEHVVDPLLILDEIWRIAKPGASIHVKVPHFSSFYAWQDPTHRRGFSYFTFNYLTRQSPFGYYAKSRFEIVDRRLLYLLPYPQPKDEWLRPLIPVGRLLEWLANAVPFGAERFWCYWVGGFSELRAELRVVK